MTLPPLTKRQIFESLNICNRCVHRFYLLRIKPRGWKRYPNIVAVHAEGYDVDNIFWWVEKTFQVYTRDIPMSNQAHMGDHVLTCKVVGADETLKLHTVEIVGGDQDGERLDVGYGWIDRYIAPDQSVI